MGVIKEVRTREHRLEEGRNQGGIFFLQPRKGRLSCLILVSFSFRLNTSIALTFNLTFIAFSDPLIDHRCHSHPSIFPEAAFVFHVRCSKQQEHRAGLPGARALLALN